MQTIITTRPTSLARGWQRELSLKEKLFFAFLLLIIGWIMVSILLQLLDTAIGVLDFGTLTIAVFGLLLGWLAVYISIWLQELLWHSFKSFRKQFDHHFNQLSSWQQCILYFSVFFLLLYAVLKGIAVVF
ncbi:hypothetical protein [Sphingobacterium yanglingense]|uniref:Uncharacterized protein n=1 Tax=Sphingobacterium yanglingense TaxID=1437280 RepID=A0A4R6W7I1_9SPHI|nr:hypothetical protein [Sphingobacterium yanglingense]TDQ73476.1 hypothetical protein CLV99_4530 [Sphingobacterium yanglingense]